MSTEQDQPKSENNLIFKNERFVKFSFVLFFSAIFVLADQIIKHFVFSRQNLPSGLTHFKNYYFAFSFPLPTWMMFGVYGIVLSSALWIFVRRFKQATGKELFAWTLLFGGAFSNVGERIVLGYVRDYIVLFNGIFNLADFFIILGILLLI